MLCSSEMELPNQSRELQRAEPPWVGAPKSRRRLVVTLSRGMQRNVSYLIRDLRPGRWVEEKAVEMG